MRDVWEERTSTASVKELHRSVMSEMVPSLANWNFFLVAESKSSLVFERRFHPWWTIALAVVLFPIGLLALFFRETAVVTVSIAETEEGSTLLVSGRADARVSRAIERLRM